MNCDIQLGSNRIPELMARRCDIGKVTEALLNFKKANLNLKMATDYIREFSYETEEGFNEIIDAIKKINFHFAWLKMYSDNEKAISSKLSGKVPAGVIYKRLKRASAILKKSGVKYDIELPQIARCTLDEKNTFWVYMDR